MALQFIASIYAADTIDTTGFQPGDLLLLAAGTNGYYTVPQPAGFTLLGNAHFDQTTPPLIRMAVWYRIADGTESSRLSVGGDVSLACYRNVAAPTATSGTAPEGGGGTTTWPNPVTFTGQLPVISVWVTRFGTDTFTAGSGQVLDDFTHNYTPTESYYIAWEHTTANVSSPFYTSISGVTLGNTSTGTNEFFALALIAQPSSGSAAGGGMLL